jgi:hypothetical protein
MFDPITSVQFRELLGLALLLISGGFIAFLPILRVEFACMFSDWKCFSLKCLFGRHQYQLTGRVNGMYVDLDSGLVGTTRAVYRCGRCRKTKPVEEEDYE